MGEINSKIEDARKSLRKLHDKYLKEFHDIHLKIDSYLDSLQENEPEVSNYE